MAKIPVSTTPMMPVTPTGATIGVSTASNLANYLGRAVSYLPSGARLFGSAIGAMSTRVRSVCSRVSQAFKRTTAEVKDLGVVSFATKRVAYGVGGVKGNDNTIAACRKRLIELSGSDFLADLLRSSAPGFGAALIELGKKELHRKDELFQEEQKAKGLKAKKGWAPLLFASIGPGLTSLSPKPLETLLLKIFTNLAEASQPPGRQGPSPNIVMDMVAFLSKIMQEHINGKDGIREKIGKVEAISDPVRRREELGKLFKDMHAEIMDIILPNKARDLDLGYRCFPLNNRIYGLLNDPQLTVMLYENLLEPTISATQREEIFSKTTGGRLLLHAARLTGEQGAKLLLELCIVESPDIARQICPIKNKKDQLSQVWIADQLKTLSAEVQTPHDPALEGIGKLGGYVLESAATQIFMNLATQNGTVPLRPGEDPFPRIAIRLKDILGEIYKEQGKALKKQHRDQLVDYQQYRQKHLELKKLKNEGPHADPTLEFERLRKIKILRRWMKTWNSKASRTQMVETLFTQMATKLIEATGIEERLNLFGQKKTIRASIAEGLCTLYELTVAEFPAFIDYFLPAEDAEASQKTLSALPNGPTCVNLVDGAASVLPVRKFLVDFLRNRVNRRELSKETAESIDLLLPDSMRLPNDLKYYIVQAMSNGLRNVAQRDPYQDALWQFGFEHIKKIANDTFIHRITADQKAGHAALPNPLLSILEECMGVIYDFRTQKGAILEQEFAALPQNPTEEDLENIYTLLRDHLVNKLLEATGLNTLLSGSGLLTIFELHEAIVKSLTRQCYKFCKRFAALPTLQNEAHEELCTTLYDENQHLAKLQEDVDLGNLALQATLKSSASPKGKTAAQLEDLWKLSGTSDIAELIEKGTTFIASLLLPKCIENAEKISKSAVLNMGLLETSPVAKFIEEAITSSNSQKSIKKAFGHLQKWLSLFLNQAAANLISSTPVNRNSGNHQHADIAGRVLVRVCSAASNALALTTTTPSGITAAVTVPSSARFTRLAQQLLKMASQKGESKKVRLPLRGAPLQFSQESWQDFIIPKLESWLEKTFRDMTPDVQELEKKLLALSGNRKVIQFCNRMAIVIRGATPFSMHRDQERMGRDIYNDIEHLLTKRKTEPAKALLKSLQENDEDVQKFLSHSMGLIGGDPEIQKALDSTLWPSLQQYVYPTLLTLMLKVSETFHAADQNQNFFLKVAKSLLQLVGKHLEVMNKVTKQNGNSSPYQLTVEEMAAGFAGELDPALRDGIGQPPEEVAAIRIERFFVPEMERFLKLIGFTADDLPVPENMRQSVFTLFSKKLAPLAMQLMFGTLFKEDRKEETLDKLELKVWDNLKTMLEAINARVAPEDVTEDDEEDVDRELVLGCGNVIRQFVKTLPEPLIKGVMSIASIENISAYQWGKALQKWISEMRATQIIDMGVEISLSSLFPNEEWNNDEFPLREERFQPALTPAEERKLAREARARANEVNRKAAEVPTQGALIMIRQFFEWLSKKIETAIVYAFLKTFGKHGEELSKEVVKIIKYVSSLLSWALLPVNLAVNALVQFVVRSIMRHQARVVSRNMRHPTNVNVLYRAWKCMRQHTEDALGVGSTAKRVNKVALATGCANE